MKRKKVGIITRHAIANYGSFFQTYATQKIIESMGYDAEIINYIPIEEQPQNLTDTYIKNSKIWNINIFTRLLYKLFQKNNIKYMNQRFDEYRRELLNLSNKEYNSLSELSQDSPIADIYCTGSDQVWGKIGTKDYDEVYFLEFVNNNKKCISFAASFGKTKISKDLINKLPNLLKKYSSLLVRENTAVELINSLGYKNVNEVLDPTLVLDKNIWEEMLLPINVSKKYIFIYQLHHNKFFDKYAKYVSKITGLDLIRVNPSKYFALKPGKFKYLVRPGEFLNYIKNAEYILTDSFHGTVFSILFNKKFVDILPNETSTRITSVLELFGLTDRIVHQKMDINVLYHNIDYNIINNILSNEKNYTINCLKDSLKMGEKNNEE